MIIGPRVIFAVFALFASSPAWAQKVSFTTPEKACRLKSRNRKVKQSKFANFTGRLDSGLEARGVIKKGLIMFAVKDAKYRDQLFLGRQNCLVAGSGSLNGGAAADATLSSGDEADSGGGETTTLHSGLYAKVIGVYMTESLVFAATTGVKEALIATDIGGALGLGYDFGGSSFATSLEFMPFFASSKIKNKGAPEAFEYTGKGIVIGALLNIVGHYHFTQAFGAGLFLPVGVRIQSFPSQTQGKVSDASTKALYGGGLSLRADLGRLRLNAQAGSLFFKSDLFIGFGAEIEL